MDSGKKPGCGVVVLILLSLFIFFFAVLYSPNRHFVSQDNFHKTGKIKSHAGLYIRSEANSKALILGTVPYNETVLIIDSSGRSETISGQASNWVKIEYNGTQGWVWGGLIEQ
jgi:uncharacterized protein YgiM (DUF1202 family)